MCAVLFLCRNFVDFALHTRFLWHILLCPPRANTLKQIVCAQMLNANVKARAFSRIWLVLLCMLSFKGCQFCRQFKVNQCDNFTECYGFCKGKTTFLLVSKYKAFFSDNKYNNCLYWSCEDVCDILCFLLDSSFI